MYLSPLNDTLNVFEKWIIHDMVFCEGNGILIFRIKLNIKRHAIRIPII